MNETTTEVKEESKEKEFTFQGSLEDFKKHADELYKMLIVDKK